MIGPHLIINNDESVLYKNIFPDDVLVQDGLVIIPTIFFFTFSPQPPPVFARPNPNLESGQADRTKRSFQSGQMSGSALPPTMMAPAPDSVTGNPVGGGPPGRPGRSIASMRANAEARASGGPSFGGGALPSGPGASSQPGSFGGGGGASMPPPPQQSGFGALPGFGETSNAPPGAGSPGRPGRPSAFGSGYPPEQGYNAGAAQDSFGGGLPPGPSQMPPAPPQQQGFYQQQDQQQFGGGSSSHSAGALSPTSQMPQGMASSPMSQNSQQGGMYQDPNQFNPQQFHSGAQGYGANQQQVQMGDSNTALAALANAPLLVPNATAQDQARWAFCCSARDFLGANCPYDVPRIS